MRWLLLSLAACGYSPTAATSGGDGPIGDDSGETTPPQTCFGTFETVCLKTLPTDDFTLGGGNNSFDTGQLSNCAETVDGTTVVGCVIAATSITIDGTLTATGPRPLILLATTGAITIPSGQLLDVASHRGTNKLGAGADPTGSCDGGTAAAKAAGGAGGSFVGSGGTGGNDQGFAAGGTPNPTVMPTDLRGGCGGQLGGTAPGALGGGGGGGGLLLIAHSIIVDGDINASGGGGEGGVGDPSLNRGGNGGGSGGMAVFDTASLSITGKVMAQGGGGGEAASTTNSDSGDNGDDPSSTGTAARGGSGGSGNNGGDGAVDTDGESGVNGVTTRSGGGGGGGAGLILFVGSSNTASGSTIRPPPTTQ